MLVAALAIVGAACLPPAAPAPPAAAELQITPGTEAFVDDSPRPGGQAEQFTVKNVGGQTTGVVGTPVIVGDPEFSAALGTCADGDGRLSPDETCEITVQFTADSGGGVAVAPSQVQISASPGGTASAALTGTEFDSTPLGVSFSDADFADANTPGGDTLTFIVNNPTSVPADGFTAALQDEAGFGDFSLDATQCGTAAPAADSCLLFVTYTNDAGDASAATAKLVVSAAFSDVVVIPLTGIAVGTPNALTIDAGAGNIDDSFLDVVPSGPLVLTVTNTGSVSTGTLDAIFNGSTGDGIWGGESNTCAGAVLAPGGTCTLGVTYRAVSGFGGTLTVQVSGTPGGFASVTITGTPTS